jgi:hypothetical protein
MAKSVDIGTLVHEVREVHDANPSWTLDNAFVQWFLQAFLVPDPIIASRAVTGVSHDKGVDGIYVDDSVSKVFVLQGKFHQGPKPPTEPRSAVVSFAQLAKTILGPRVEFESYLQDIDPAVGQRIREARERAQRRAYELHLYYVTTGRCSSPLKSEAEAAIAQANGKASVTVLDRGDVLALLIDYLGGAAPPVPYLDLQIDARGVSGSDGVIQRYDAESGIESWILTVSGQEGAHLYSRAGDRLFARNIRGFLGDTAINEGMKNTLRKSPEYFWYFNNGVTIVCDSARKTSESGHAILRVTNPQIINGQQTTRTLHSTPTKKSAVLVRVISIPRDKDRGKSDFEGLVSNIVAATNWQNAILPSDLRANDTRQISLQRDLAKLRYHYLRKRQTKGEARRSLGNLSFFWIKKDELAQVVGACELDPVMVRSGKEGLFKPPLYDKIFDGRPVREYLSMYWVGRVIKYKGSGVPDRAYAKWYALHALWKAVAPMLRRKAVADHFRERYERGRWFESLDVAADQIYRSLLDFFRHRRGKGPHAADVSNFFYRPHQHTAFERYWRSSGNAKRRTRAKIALRRFRDDLEQSAS